MSKDQIDRMPGSDMDGGWKDILEDFAEDFFRFYLPGMHEAMDFEKGIKFLDKELNEIISDSDNIKREADKLLEVYLKDGSTEWILIHIEVQSYRDDKFGERMYIYNYRIFDKYRKRVVSIAVLIDNDRNFRPDNFRMEQFGCEISFRFPVIKLLDYDSDEQLPENGNPFAVVTRVQLAKHATEKDVGKRYDLRMGLTKELYKRGYSKEQVVKLYKFIDYILRLPKPQAIQFKSELEEFEESQKMPYVTSTELIAREEEALRNKQEDVLEILEVRFGSVPVPVKEKIVYCHDLNALKKSLRKAAVIKSLDEFTI